MFERGRLTLGVFFPIEAFTGDQPAMQGQVTLAQRAERGGFAALWFRDVPLRDPAFGDLGQVFDPWVYLGYIAAHTRTIALATGSIVLPIRHPIHAAKAAASVDQLSRGRLVLGVASGDRPVEFPAFGVDFDARGEIFREHLHAFRRLLGESFPSLEGSYGTLRGADVVPKPWAAGIPLLVTGNSRQSLEWIAQHADGWVTYPRGLEAQQRVIQGWHVLAEQHRPGEFLPFAQSLYIDLADEPGLLPQPIHLGWRLGRHRLVELLTTLAASGANHVVFNLKYGRRPADEVLDELIETVVPEFPVRHAVNPLRPALQTAAP
jgi:luciferase-type oxidoreductase